MELSAISSICKILWIYNFLKNIRTTIAINNTNKLKYLNSSYVKYPHSLPIFTIKEVLRS